MTVDCRGAGAVGDNVLDGDVSDDPCRRLIGALRAVHFAAALDVEVNRVAISPPEPIEAPGLNGEVRDNDVFHHSSVKHHKGQPTVGVGDGDVTYNDSPYGFRVAIAELDCA